MWTHTYVAWEVGRVTGVRWEYTNAGKSYREARCSRDRVEREA